MLAVSGGVYILSRNLLRDSLDQKCIPDAIFHGRALAFEINW